MRRESQRRANYISYSTVSPSLAYQLQLLVASLGYTSSIHRSIRTEGIGKTRKPIYDVKVSGKSYYSLLEELGFEVPKGKQDVQRQQDLEELPPLKSPLH